MAESDIQRDLGKLEAGIRQLEAEYNMYFAGRLPKPPWETRSKVEEMVRRYDRAHISNYGDRFRFTTLQSRFAALVDLWDRGLRAREEGRAGPFAHTRAQNAEAKPEDRIVGVTSFQDPLQEMDKLHDLYESLTEARRTVGDQPVPFHKFAELVKDQVNRMKASGSPEVAFRVAVKDGKVRLTARGLQGMKPDEG
ncbi:MAG: MXAN_5187 C-terminal domain-containing protein [Vicinamibacterales bacterium]